MAKALTVKFVEAVKPEAVRREIPDGGLPGLYLIVQPSGAMSWAIRYRAGGKPRKMTIGAYPLYGLATAREAAGKALRAVSEGRDPGEEKKAAKRARPDDQNLIGAVLNDFVSRHVEAKNRASSAKESKRLIEVEIRPRWGKRPIQSITRREVIELLDEIADRGAPVTANRVHALLRKFFNWAIERDIIQTTPVANVKAPTAEVSRDRVLSHDEIRLAWLGAEAIGWPFGPMVKVLLLTGQRRDEVASATWDEFQLDGPAPCWIIPKERAKNNQTHVVPLSPAVVSILRELPRLKSKRGYVLTTTGETPISGFSKAKAGLDLEMLTIAHRESVERGEDISGMTLAKWRIHDLRRTAASGMAALGQPVHVVEAVLNHRSGAIKGVAAIYNRHDYLEEKRRALSAWANLVMGIVEQKDAGNVIPIDRVQA